MKRGEIKTHIRTLCDELTVAPEGMFTDEQLNTLVNIAQRNVEIDLIEYIPWYFRTSKKFSITADKREYDIVSDIGITDLLLFDTILHNKTGERPNPLLYCDPDELWQHVAVGDTGSDPEIWGYEDKDNIFIEPTPSGTEADRLKAVYFKKVPDLTHDTSDISPEVATPHLPESTHELIAIEVVKLWHIADEEEASDIEERYNRMLFTTTYRLSAPQGIRASLSPNIKEHLHRHKLDVNTNRY